MFGFAVGWAQVIDDHDEWRDSAQGFQGTFSLEYRHPTKPREAAPR